MLYRIRFDRLPQVDAFVSAAEEFTSEEGVSNARWKILGGSSAINAGFYSRADDEFYERSGISFDYQWIDCISTGVDDVAILVKRWFVGVWTVLGCLLLLVPK